MQQQRSPPGEKLGAGVELNLQEVATGELLPARETFADDSCTRADFVVAVTDPGEHLAIDDTCVGRPDSPALGVQHPRVFVARQPAAPTGFPVRPRDGDAAVEPGAARDRAVDRPTDSAALVSSHEVLTGYSQSVHRVERFLNRSGRLETRDRHAQACGIVR